MGWRPPRTARTASWCCASPVGPCLLITPWNFPLAMGTRKIGPAAAGCTMVLKPAPQTPLSSLALAAILTEAGLPDGVLNVVTTSDAAGVVEPLLRGGAIRKLSFTGSTQVGKILLAQCADAVVRPSMELGGTPVIVFDDADLDVAVEGTMLAKMRNMGEACAAANRIYVHRSLAGEFAARLADRMAALTVGDGTEPGTDVGPLIDEADRRKVLPGGWWANCWSSRRRTVAIERFTCIRIRTLPARRSCGGHWAKWYATSARKCLVAGAGSCTSRFR